jgi:hypothetical protein
MSEKFEVDADSIECGLAVHKWIDDWRVTHVASGLKCGHRKTKRAAVAMRKRLLALPVDWTLPKTRLLKAMRAGGILREAMTVAQSQQRRLRSNEE